MPRWPADVELDPDSFGAMLRRLRISAGLSQNQLARQAGCDPAYVNRFEIGKGHARKDGQPNVPGRAIVLAFAEVLDLSQSQADRLLYAAGLAPQEDWQTRAVRAETALATVRQALDDATAAEGEPTFIRNRVG